MTGRALLALIAALAALCLGTSGASASPWIQKVEPAGNSLDFGTVEVFGTSVPRRITIRNLGSDPPYWVRRTLFGNYQETVSGSLAPGDSQSWDYVATPGPDELPDCGGAFFLEWKDTPGGDTHEIQVYFACTAVLGPYQGAPSPAFGNVTVGTSAVLTLPVTNTSAVPRTVTGLAMSSGRFAAALHGGALPITVPAGGMFQVDVTFSPLLPNFHTSDLVITDGDGPHLGFRITGQGVPAPPIALSTTALAFGATFRHPSTPPTAAVQITNVGSASLTVPPATVTGVGFSLASSPSGSLPPQGSATYVVAFEPDAVGAFQGALVVSGVGQVALAGQGVLRPVSTAAELDLGIAVVGTVARRSLTLHNAGTVAITVASLDVSDPRFHVVSTDRTIPPLGELVVELEHAPTAEGEAVAALAIALDADPEPQLTVALRGTGYAIDPPADPAPGEPPLYLAPGAAPAGPVSAGGSGGCSTHGASGPLAALALALVPFFRRRRARS